MKQNEMFTLDNLKSVSKPDVECDDGRNCVALAAQDAQGAQL